LQSLISTRTVRELIEWIKGFPSPQCVPLGMKIGSERAIERYRYQKGKEKDCVNCIRFCGNFGDCAATSDPPEVIKDNSTAYTVRDAVLESLAMYIEEGQEVKNLIASLQVPSNTKASIPCEMPLCIYEIMSMGSQNGDLVKSAIVSVLWSILPLQLDLRVKYHKERPQYYEPGSDIPRKNKLLNPNAQPHWKKLRDFKGPTSGDFDFDPSEQRAWEAGKAISMSSTMRSFRAARCFLQLTI